MPQRSREVWHADLGLAAQAQPVVVVSRNDPDTQTFIRHYCKGIAENSKVTVFCDVCTVLSEYGTIAYQECRVISARALSIVPVATSRAVASALAWLQPAWETGPLVEDELAIIPLLD